MVQKRSSRKRKALSTQAVQAQLTAEDQSAYIMWLLRGASPAAAAAQLEIDLFVIVEAIADDEEFRIKVDAAYDALSQNVAAKLYQEAMKGSMSAITLWLKNRPPPEWPDGQLEKLPDSGLEVLSDEELLRLARLENIAIPPELETDVVASPGP